MIKFEGIQPILSQMRRAIDTYEMIEENDKIAVALSRWKRFNYHFNRLKTSANFLSKKI